MGIVRSGGASASTLESANRRLLLAPGERIEVQLHPSTSTSAVTVRADDGGVINGLQRQTQVELPTNTTSFSFTAGGHRGLYTVTVTRPRRSPETVRRCSREVDRRAISDS